MNFLSMLNDEQRNAVTNAEGKNLIIAGAGSGKTTCLVSRIKYLVSKGVKPSDILSITFTNKAAKELIDRIKADNIDTSDMWTGTFHSIALRILRESNPKYRDITIYDEEDSNKLATKILKEMSECGFEVEENVSNYLNKVSKFKSNLMSVDDVNTQGIKEFSVNTFYMMYEKALRENNAIDFDSMIYHCVLLLLNDTKTREKYSKKFKYINVDEGQDTDIAQMRLIDLLSTVHGNVTIYADDYQSIYSFRNANLRAFLDYVAEYNKYFITTNYRSTEQIIAASNSLIKKNKDQIHKTCKSNDKKGAKPAFMTLRNDIAEAAYVANNIKYLHENKGLKYSEIAVLYRSNAYSISIEQELRKRGIPYIISQNISFFKRKEIKDLMAYVKYIINPNDMISVERILSLQQGIGEKTIEKIINASKESSVHIEDLRKTKIKGVGAKALDSFNSIIDIVVTLRSELLQDDNHINICKMLNNIYTLTGYKELLVKNNEDDRLKNIDILFDIAVEYEQLGYDIYTFSQTISAASEESDENSDSVKLMTVHASKGLEFKAVFLIGASEFIFPVPAPNVDIEEEEDCSTLQ